MPASFNGLANRGAARTLRPGREQLPDVLREHEADVFLGDLELRDLLRAAGPEVVDQPLHELLGRAGARSDAERIDPFEPFVPDLVLVVDQVRASAVLARHL